VHYIFSSFVPLSLFRGGSKPVATGGIRGNAATTFLWPEKFVLTTIIKRKILSP